MHEVITNNLELWTSALLTKSTIGRGSNGKLEAYGIKKLRELILDLAMSGKLIEQDQNDEPPYDALKRAKRWPLKVDRNSDHIPGSWISVPLEVLAADTKYPIGDGDHGQIKPAFYTDFGVPYIRVADLGWGTYEPNGLVHIPESVHEQNLKSELRPGDILIAKTGATIGKCCIVPASIPKANTTSSVGKVTVNQNLVLPKWIINYFLSGGFKENMWAVSKKTAQPGFNIINLKRFVVPVPPLAEQHRIVAKVEELMTLCDQLEQQQTYSLEAHQTLVRALLGTLTRVESHRELVEAWVRIFEHFDTLFTIEQSIDQLKKAILQLAVMGKLVPQDPDDEPANVLLERISKAKSKLVEKGVIRKQYPLPTIGDAEAPFALPTGWRFVRLSDLSKLITKGSSPKWQGVSYTDNPDDVLFVTSENVGSYALLLDNKKYVEKIFNDVEPRSILEKGDFLMNIVGASIGRTAIYDIDVIANINQAVCLIRVFAELLDCKYLLHFFNSVTCVSYMYDKQVDNARANLSMGNIAGFVVPLPPLAEQHRIVAKVDELMTLCDDLKAHLAYAQTIQIHLANTIVEHAVA